MSTSRIRMVSSGPPEVARDETDCGTQDGPQNQRRHPDRKRDASAEYESTEYVPAGSVGT